MTLLLERVIEEASSSAALDAEWQEDEVDHDRQRAAEVTAEQTVQCSRELRTAQPPAVASAHRECAVALTNHVNRFSHSLKPAVYAKLSVERQAALRALVQERSKTFAAAARAASHEAEAAAQRASEAEAAAAAADAPAGALEAAEEARGVRAAAVDALRDAIARGLQILNYGTQVCAALEQVSMNDISDHLMTSGDCNMIA